MFWYFFQVLNCFYSWFWQLNKDKLEAALRPIDSWANEMWSATVKYGKMQLWGFESLGGLAEAQTYSTSSTRKQSIMCERLSAHKTTTMFQISPSGRTQIQQTAPACGPFLSLFFALLLKTHTDTQVVNMLSSSSDSVLYILIGIWSKNTPSLFRIL